MAADLAPKSNPASWVVDRWRECDGMLSSDRRNYWLNTAFYEGDQWTFWNQTQRTVMNVPKQDGRAQVTNNRIQPNLAILKSKMLKRKLVFEVPPSAADDLSMGGARLGEHVLEATRATQGWEKVREVNLFNCFMGSASAILCEWDPSTGKQLFVDDRTGKVVNEGDVQLTPLSIAEFTIEPGTTDWRQARWVLVCRAMSPGQAKEHYGLDYDPEPDASAQGSPFSRQGGLGGGMGGNKSVLVYTYYERPGAKSNGRHVVVIDGKAVVDEEWPFPFTSLPIYIFRVATMPKRWTGHTFMDDVRPRQALLNALESVVWEHAKLAGAAKLAIPDDAGITADDITDTPGEFIFYNGLSSKPPMYIAPAQVPRWMMQTLEGASRSIDDQMGVHDISRGEAPGDRNSGAALAVLAEKDETPMGGVARDQSEGWGEIASHCLEMWESKVAEYRETTMMGEANVPVVREWKGEYLRGQTIATVPLDAVMPYSKAAMQAWTLNLMQQSPAFAAAVGPSLPKLMELPHADEMMALLDADAARAQKENFRLLNNHIEIPETFDDHAKHIAEHNRARKSEAYRNADREVRKTFDDHVKAHETLAAEEAINQQALDQQHPGASTLPQENEPPGSTVPPDHAERMAAMQVANKGGTPASPEKAA